MHVQPINYPEVYTLKRKIKDFRASTKCIATLIERQNLGKQTLPDKSLKLETMVGQWARVWHA